VCSSDLLAYSAVYTGMRALTNGLGARSL